ncbi:class I SAM-dependent methyltransferase [Rubrobacter taiwanensis]|jgi:SAM-dependent methyltransferase|uniref:Class I SAM-dependent methyltransferase n=1 Tax=Rubrobacter taiwanensis TaxID=185139 RepID=A0A4R1BNK8_9ACTN|nr:class I SAM-dependent methyltransferase [Rubrobacter taiwanensis]
MPLSPGEREEYESDLIAFCDRELDLLGEIRGLRTLYAGGAAALWIEGLSQRLGEEGELHVLELDAGKVEAARELLREAALAAPVRLIRGDVHAPPFEAGSFDLVYSAGLFHELDVSERPAEAALEGMAALLRPGGRLATSDFVDQVPALQLEDEALEAELARAGGRRLYGIGPPERLVKLHRKVLSGLRWHISPPFRIRHLGRVIVEGDDFAQRARGSGLLRRRARFLERVRREGYTRPATLYVEGFAPTVPGSRSRGRS